MLVHGRDTLYQGWVLGLMGKTWTSGYLEKPVF